MLNEHYVKKSGHNPNTGTAPRAWLAAAELGLGRFAADALVELGRAKQADPTTPHVEVNRSGVVWGNAADVSNHLSALEGRYRTNTLPLGIFPWAGRETLVGVGQYAGMFRLDRLGTLIVSEGLKAMGDPALQPFMQNVDPAIISAANAMQTGATQTVVYL